MSTADANDEADLERTLAEVRRPREHARLPSAPLRIRLGTSPAIRRLVPRSVDARRAGKRGERTWERSAEARRHALVVMSAMLSGTEREGEIEALARLWIIETEVLRSLMWHPWKPVRIREDSLARLRGAVAERRGVLLTGCHQGAYYRTSSAGAQIGQPVFSTIGGWMLEPLEPGYWGRYVAWRLDAIRSNGARAVPAAGSFRILSALLQQGEVVLVQFDNPGRQETRFLGKPVMLRTGTAKLAQHSGAIVVPVLTRREGHHTFLDVGEPLDPTDFDDPLEMHRAIALVHERWILEYPEGLEDPLRDGGWPGATPERWPDPAGG